MVRSGLLVFALVACSFAFGCAGTALSGLDIADARIENATWATVATLGGISTMSGDLVAVDTGGGAHRVPVTLSGPVLGVLLSVHATPTDDECLSQAYDTSMTLPDSSVPGDALFGGYFGSSGAIAIGFGVESRELENAGGIKIKSSGLTTGVGMFAGFEWLTLGEESGS